MLSPFKKNEPIEPAEGKLVFTFTHLDGEVEGIEGDTIENDGAEHIVKIDGDVVYSVAKSVITRIQQKRKR